MGCGKQREATAPIHPSKIATLVPEFAVEDLPLYRIAALVPEFCTAGPALGQNSDDDDDDDDDDIYTGEE